MSMVNANKMPDLFIYNVCDYILGVLSLGQCLYQEETNVEYCVKQKYLPMPHAYNNHRQDETK